MTTTGQNERSLGQPQARGGTAKRAPLAVWPPRVAARSLVISRAPSRARQAEEG